MFIQVCALGDELPSNTGRIEDFAGFPQDRTENFYYVRTYPYVTVCILAAAVSGLLYYNRAHFKKRISQLLRIVHMEVVPDDTDQEKALI